MVGRDSPTGEEAEEEEEEQKAPGGEIDESAGWLDCSRENEEAGRVLGFTARFEREENADFLAWSFVSVDFLNGKNELVRDEDDEGDKGERLLPA